MELKERVMASVVGFLFILFSMSPETARAQYDDVSLETFYEELAPYGDWIRDPQYGMVWRPDVDQDEFRPYYSDGHWEMTKYGNTWVSDYDWGWAPFHYGRWDHSSRRGWIWIPDVHWGPAWVSWRSGGGYYGWAPLGPRINININFGRTPDLWWVFIPKRHIYYDRYPRYDYRHNRAIYHNTVIINNTYVYNRNTYYTGPRADEIRRSTRQPVKIHEVRDQRPSYAGRSNRPEVINRTGSSSQNPRPDRSSVNSGTRSSETSSAAVRSNTGNLNPSTDRSSNAGSERTVRTGESQNSQGLSRPERTISRPTDSKAAADRQPSTRAVPSQSQASERSAENRSSSGQQRSSQTPDRADRTSTPQRTSTPASPARSERTQESRPSSSPSRQSAPSSSREEARSTPARESSSRGSSTSTPSRSTESSSSSRPSRGN